MPVLTRVRRKFADVTKFCLGELLGVEGLDVLLGVRARVCAPGLSSRPGMGTSGLVNGPTLTASAALRRCGFRRGFGLPRVPRRRPSPAACLESNGVVSKLVKDPSVVIVRGKTIPARWPFFLSLRPRRRSNMMMRTIFARIHCNFRRMFPFRSFFAESKLRKNICRIFADSINVAQNTHKR